MIGKTPAYINVYMEFRRNGGPEEGGWYYNEGYPLAFVNVTDFDDTEKVQMSTFLSRAFIEKYPYETDVHIRVFEEDHRPRHYPINTPHYE